MTLQLTRELAAEVRAAAAKRQVTYTAIAEELNLSVMAVSRRMRGLTGWTAVEIFQLAPFLDVAVGDLSPKSAAADSPPPVESAAVSSRAVVAA